MKTLLLLTILFANLSLTACSTIMENLPGVYKIDIKQGNIIDQDMVDQLRPNMSKRQVLYIMGSPMLADTFHKQRWDYIYSIREKGDPTTQKRIALFFSGDALTRIEGDFKPNNTPEVKLSKDTTVDIPPRNLEKTLWEMITGVFGFDDQQQTLARTTPRESANDRQLEVQQDIPH